MATRRKPSKTSRERRETSAREERRAAEVLALARSASAYTAALDILAGATVVLMRGGRALDQARSAAVVPELVRYGMVGRLRPADVQRTVHSVTRDLAAKVAFARGAELVVPDGTEEAYGLLVSRLAEASDLVASAIDDFGKSVPRMSSKPHPVIRDLILSAAGAASALNRLVGRNRAAASVHSSAVHDEIVSNKDVSFY